VDVGYFGCGGGKTPPHKPLRSARPLTFLSISIKQAKLSEAQYIMLMNVLMVVIGTNLQLNELMRS